MGRGKPLMPSDFDPGLKKPRCARSAESLGPGGKKKISVRIYLHGSVKRTLQLCRRFNVPSGPRGHDTALPQLRPENDAVFGYHETWRKPSFPHQKATKTIKNHQNGQEMFIDCTTSHHLEPNVTGCYGYLTCFCWFG